MGGNDLRKKLDLMIHCRLQLSGTKLQLDLLPGPGSFIFLASAKLERRIMNNPLHLPRKRTELSSIEGMYFPEQHTLPLPDWRAEIIPGAH